MPSSDSAVDVIHTVATPGSSVATAIGRPMPAKRGACRRYIRHTDATTWPVLRRRASRSGAEGDHVVRRTSHAMRTASAASASTAHEGLLTVARNTSDPVATIPQNAPVAWVPKSPLAGTAYAVSTPSASVQVSGAVHWSLVFGPVGPL